MKAARTISTFMILGALAFATGCKHDTSKLKFKGRAYAVQYDDGGTFAPPAPLQEGTRCAYHLRVGRADQPGAWPVKYDGALELGSHGEFEIDEKIPVKPLVAGAKVSPQDLTFTLRVDLTCGASGYTVVRNYALSPKSVAQGVYSADQVKISSDLSKIELKLESWSDARDAIAKLQPVHATLQSDIETLFSADHSLGAMYFLRSAVDLR